jgi:hypothetical protein
MDAGCHRRRGGSACGSPEVPSRKDLGLDPPRFGPYGVIPDPPRIIRRAGSLAACASRKTQPTSMPLERAAAGSPRWVSAVFDAETRAISSVARLDRAIAHLLGPPVRAAASGRSRPAGSE